MATPGILSLNVLARVLIGGETKAADILRDHLTAYTEVIQDSMVTLAEGQAAGSPTTLWQSASHGSAVNPLPEQFAFGLILPDPGATQGSVLPIDIELTATRNNSTTVTDLVGVRRITREKPIILGTSLCGLDFTNIGSVATPGTVFAHITRIRARNPNSAGATAGANNCPVRLVLLR